MADIHSISNLYLSRCIPLRALISFSRETCSRKKGGIFVDWRRGRTSAYGHTTKIQENVDWESCKSKYSEIGDLFQAQYPRTPTEKDFPHDLNAITQGQLTAKLQQIRIKYRHAVNLKPRSGQGCVVLIRGSWCFTSVTEQRAWFNGNVTDRCHGWRKTH